jgi:hypothetical protein
MGASFEAFAKGADLYLADSAYYDREGSAVLLRHAENAVNPQAIKQQTYTVRV